jgi:hypothetical protein
MSRRVEADPDVRLRLEGGERGALRHGARDGRLEIVDRDLEVHLHLRLPGLAGQTGGT